MSVKAALFLISGGLQPGRLVSSALFLLLHSLLLLLPLSLLSGVRLARLERHQLRVVGVASVQVLAVVGVEEGGDLGDGRGRVGGGAHGAVLLPPLAPLGLVLHPLPFQGHLHLDTHTHENVRGHMETSH